MFALFALTAVSFADQEGAAPVPPDCDSEILYSLPVNGAVDLPSSIRPFVQFGGCGEALQIRVLNADGRVLSEVESESYSGTSLELPSLDLEPGDYSLMARGMSGEILYWSDFSVGVDAPDDVPARPLISVYAYSYSGDEDWVNAEVYFEDVPSEGIVSVEVEGGTPVLAPVHDGIIYMSHALDSAEVCYSARVRGVSGTWSEAETVCVEPYLEYYDEDFEGWCGTGSGPFFLLGCSVTGTPAGGGFLLAITAGLLRRRRS